MPGGAYPNEHDPRDLYNSNETTTTTPTATTSVAMPSARAAHRKLSDYCGIFAEKTNRIGKNVESFMQSRGLLPVRRSFDETPRASNGDVVRDEHRGDQATPRENRPLHREGHESRSERKKRVVYANSHVDRAHRRSRRRECAVDYEEDVWQRGVSKPILRNGVHHGADERPCYSTLPRRTINFKDQASRDSDRRAYPKSLQDLTELDDVTYLPSSSSSRGDERLERRRRNELAFDDDYLRLCRNLSRVDKYPRGGRYEPGQVHYERECRTFGKDTVAFIYYKTCYL